MYLAQVTRLGAVVDWPEGSTPPSGTVALSAQTSVSFTLSLTLISPLSLTPAPTACPLRELQLECNWPNAPPRVLRDSGSGATVTSLC